jgi:predicted nucleotidyltransferase
VKKVIVCGPYNAGKTSFIKNVNPEEFVGTEENEIDIELLEVLPTTTTVGVEINSVKIKEKEIVFLKRTTRDSIGDFHSYAREIARKEHKNTETILKNNRIEIKNTIEFLKTKLEDIEPKIEALRKIEAENKELRKENRRLQNTLNRISSKIKKGK